MGRIVLLLAIITAMFARVAGADEPAKPESSATGILRITAEPDSGLADERLVLALVMTKSLLKEAVSNVSKEAASETCEVASVEWTQDGGITLDVKSYDQRVPADKLLDALADSLSDRLRALDVAHTRNHARSERLTLQVERIGANLKTQYAALAQLAALYSVYTNAELSAQRQVRLEAELQSLHVQSQGLNARQEILEHQVADLGKKVAEGAGADPAVLKELMKSVEARKKIVDYAALTVAKDAATLDTLEEAKDKLAKAEIELAKYRRAAADAAGGGRIEELKRRLDDTAIELAEIAARRDVVKMQLDQASNDSGKVEIKRLDVERLKQDYRDASDELSQLRRKLDLYLPPSVMLVPLR